MKNGIKLSVFVFLILVTFLNSATVFAKSAKSSNTLSGRHWVWINPDQNDHPDSLVLRYTKFKNAGIVGVFLKVIVKNISEQLSLADWKLTDGCGL